MSKITRMLAMLLTLAMLASGMPVLAEETIELTPEQIAELTGVEETLEEVKPEETASEEAAAAETPEQKAVAGLTEESIEESAAEHEPVANPSEEPAAEAEEEPSDVGDAEVEKPAVEPTEAPAAETIVEAEVEPTVEAATAGSARAIPRTAEELCAFFGLNEEELVYMTGVSYEKLQSYDPEMIHAIFDSLCEMMGIEPLKEEAGDFEIRDGELVRYKGNGGHVVVPDGVTSIGGSAFVNCKTLTSISMPNVTSIGNYAFSYCEKLSSISMPKVTSIGIHAFYYCGKLSSVTMPKVSSIGNNVFNGCDSLTSISMPEVSSIGDSAFSGCKSLTGVEIPKVSSIGNHAFSGCKSLTGVEMPNVTSIGASAFFGCDSLTDVEMPKVSSIGNNVFNGCDSLTSISMPEVSSIGDSAFSGCKSLTSVEMPKVSSIGNNVFNGCDSLTSVALANVSSIGQNAFGSYFLGANKLNLIVPKNSYAHEYCKENKLCYTFSGSDAKDSFTIVNGVLTAYTGNEETVVVPDGVTAIGKEVFYSRRGIVRVELPSGVKGIAAAAFQYCENLESINLPDGLTSIGENAFNQCRKLKNIELPSSLRDLGFWAFQSCESLESITIPDSVTSNLVGTFGYCKNLRSVDIGDGVSALNSTFMDCSSLKKIVIPNQIETLEGEVFINCSALEEVHIGSSVRYIGMQTFANCTALKEITLPENVRVIWNNAFEYCYSLEKITIPKSVQEFGASIFANCSAGLTAYVPAGSMALEYCKANGVNYEIICDHNWKNDAQTQKPGCTEDGWTMKTCTRCGAQQKELIPATGHKEVILPAIQQTCAQDGRTEGKQCGNCGLMLLEPHVLPALPHVIVTDPAREPGQTTNGLTEGSHCAVCGKVLVAQQVIPALMPNVQLATGKNADAKLNLGEKLLLVARFAEDNGWKIKSWKSSAAKVATVDSEGVVTAVAEGSATITVTTTNKKTATIKLTIADPYKPSGVTLSESSMADLKVGDGLQLTATLQPESARSELTWSTSSAKIATVDDEGMITAHAEGTATITVKTYNGKSDSMKVRVVDPFKPESVALDHEGTVVLCVGDELVLDAAMQPDTAESELSWTSSQKKVASVENGVVTAIGKGKTVITVKTRNNKKDSVNVVVVEPDVVYSVELDQSGTISLALGEGLQLNAQILPFSADSSLSWKSSKPGCAEVDEAGFVTALAEGIATINVATENGKKDTVQVKVIDPLKPDRVELDHEGTVELAVGEELCLTAEIFPGTAESGLSWSSSNKKFASIDENGVVTGLKKGTTTITVKTENGKKDTVKIKVS